MTAVLLVLSWFALRPAAWRSGLAYAGIAVAVLLIVRAAVGDAPNVYTLESVWQSNTRPRFLMSAAVYVGLLAPLMLAAVPGWRQSAPELRRLAVIVLAVYLPGWAAFAAWQETRLLMPALILLLPIVTMRTYDPVKNAAGVSGGLADGGGGRGRDRGANAGSRARVISAARSDDMPHGAGRRLPDVGADSDE